jgi:hypothetical protein
MMRIRMLALPVLAALAFPLIADAGIGLRGRFSSRSGEIVSSTPVGAPAAPGTPAKGAAAPAAPATPPARMPVGPGCSPAVPPAVAPATVAGADCYGHGIGGKHGFFGGLFSSMCGGGLADGHGGHGCLANQPPSYGQGFRGFGFCQPPFQAAPWYLYWPYDAHFQLPAPITAQFYPPQQYGNQLNPYFAGPAMGFGPAMGPGPGMGPGPMMGPGGPGPHFGPVPR